MNLPSPSTVAADRGAGRSLHRVIGIAGCATIGASLLLRWSTFYLWSPVSNGLEPSTMSGFDHDGGAVLLIISVAVGAFIWLKGPTQWTRITAMIAGLVMLCFGWVDFADSRAVLTEPGGVDGGTTGSIGIGLYVFMVGALALAASGIPDERSGA